MGRSAREGRTRDVNVILRVLSEERSRWQEAAKREGLTVSAWLRGLANRAAFDQVLAPGMKQRRTPKEKG